MCFWFWEKGVMKVGDPGLIYWSTGFSGISASATLTSSLLASAPVPSAPRTYLCPFSMAFSHVLCQNICVFPWCPSLSPDLFFCQAVPDIFPIAWFRVLDWCPSLPFLFLLCIALVSRKEAKLHWLFSLLYFLLSKQWSCFGTDFRKKNNWAEQTALWATAFRNVKFLGWAGK